MNNLNSIVLEGRLVRDSLFAVTPKGTSTSVFTLATNRTFKYDKDAELAKEETFFFEIKVFGKLAEICRDKGKKGRGVRVVGGLVQLRWTDEKTGEHKEQIYIEAEHVEYRPDDGKTETVKV